MSDVAKIAARLNQVQAVRNMSYPGILSIVQQAQTERLWQLEQGNLSKEERQEKVLAFLVKELQDRKMALEGYSTPELAQRLYNDTEQYSILTPYLDGSIPGVEGININSWRDIRIAFADGRSEKIEGFNSPRHGTDIIRRLLQESRQTIDNAIPMAEASIHDNIRVTALTTPVVDDNVGIAGYIRILRKENFSRDEYLQAGFASDEMLALLEKALRYGAPILCVGKVNTGKTSLLKYLLSSLPDALQINTVEAGAREMNLIRLDEAGQVRNNVVHMLTREHEIEAQNITQEKLLEKALRLNPDVLAMAEVRNIEANAAVEASLSGHTVISTAHAGSAKLGHHRVATLSRKKYGTDMRSAMLDACEAFPLVPFLHTTEDGVRRIMNISECWVDEEEKIHYQTLWEFQVKENQKTPEGVAVLGKFTQRNDPSPHLIERMKLYGITEAEIGSLHRKEERK